MIAHDDLDAIYPYWVKYILEEVMLRHLWPIIQELEEGIPDEYQNVGYEVSLIENQAQIRVFYRNTLLREYKDEDTEIKCYFEESPLILDEEYRQAIIEALKTMTDRNGECPEKLKPSEPWYAPAGFQRGSGPFNVTFHVDFKQELKQDLKAMHGIDIT